MTTTTIPLTCARARKSGQQHGRTPAILLMLLCLMALSVSGTSAAHAAGQPASVPAGVTPFGPFHSWQAGPSFTTGREGHSATLLTNGKILLVGGTDGGLALSDAQLYDPATGQWTPTTPLPAARSNHTATLLRNGSVLITGGEDKNAAPLNDALVFDPTYLSWSSAGTFSNARYGQTATLLPNGTVLMVGGVGTSGMIGDAQRYDPSTNAWQPAGTLATARANQTATLLANGTVLIAGGENNATAALDSAELYTPASNSWSSAGSFGIGRYGHSATALPNGKVLLVGGMNGTDLVTDAQLYTPATHTWQSVAGVPTARANHSASLLPNGTVLIAGGESGQATNDTQIYDPASNSWSSAGPMSVARAAQTATILPTSGVVFLVGGWGNGELNSTDVYTPGQSSWSNAANMIAARANHTATLLPSGKVLVTGGSDGTNTLNSAELYDPATNTWSSAASMSIARTEHSATLLANGKVLVVGGANGTDGFIHSAELYDPLSNSWSNAGSLSIGRFNHSATLLNSGKVLIVGGFGDAVSDPAHPKPGAAPILAELYDPATNSWSGGGITNGVHQATSAVLLPNGQVLIPGAFYPEVYNPATNTWTSTSDEGVYPFDSSVTLLPNSTVFVAGGTVGNGTDINTVELYDSATNTWSYGNPFWNNRMQHTATLLPNGKVLMAGGTTDTAQLNDAQLYDPATGMWSGAGSFSDARAKHTATLLPNGKVLIVGGYEGDSSLFTADLYDPGLDYTAAQQPVVTAPIVADTLAPLVLSGTKFTGATTGPGNGGSEASGGATNSSATNYPIVQIESLVNEEQVTLRLDQWSATTALTGGIPWHFPPGYARLTVFTNGVPSQAVLFPVVSAPQFPQTPPMGLTVSPGVGGPDHNHGYQATLVVTNTLDRTLPVGTAITFHLTDFVYSHRNGVGDVHVTGATLGAVSADTITATLTRAIGFGGTAVVTLDVAGRPSPRTQLKATLLTASSNAVTGFATTGATQPLMARKTRQGWHIGGTFFANNEPVLVRITPTVADAPTMVTASADGVVALDLAGVPTRTAVTVTLVGAWSGVVGTLTLPR